MDSTPSTDDAAKKASRQMKRNLIIIACDILIFLAMIAWLPLDPQVAKGLAILVFIAVLWLTEAMHVTLTAIMVPILAMILGILPGKSALTDFAHPTIFLFFGGFVLAGALHEQKIDRWIAGKILHAARGRLGLSLILIFVTTAFLSMWMSNTATAAMMLPLVIGLMSQLDYQKHKSTWVFAVLGVAYSASIGGMGTLVGSPPNAIAAAQLNMGFADWFKIGAPIMVVFGLIVFFLMKLVLKPELSLKLEQDTAETGTGDAPGLTVKQKTALIVFAMIALCWMTSSYISKAFGGVPEIDTLIALCAVIALPLSGVITWSGIVKNTDWGVLLLFGGGLTLSTLLGTTGAGKFLATEVADMATGQNLIILFLIVSLFITILTEFCSNTAAAALVCPIMVTVAAEMGIPAQPLVLLIGVGASCAFMMPVATPPNALAYATGKVPQLTMVKMGMIINIVLVFVKAGWAWLFWQ